MEEDKGRLEPRIVVTDPDDFGTVVAALVQYQHSVWSRAMLTGDFPHAMHESIIANHLLQGLMDQEEREHASKVFGSVTDETIRDGLEKLRDQLGE